MYDHSPQTALALTTFAVFALGVTYASVPLYKMFCQVLCHIIRLNTHLTVHVCNVAHWIWRHHTESGCCQSLNGETGTSKAMYKRFFDVMQYE